MWALGVGSQPFSPGEGGQRGKWAVVGKWTTGWEGHMGTSLRVRGCEPWTVTLDPHFNLDKTGMSWERGLGISWEPQHKGQSPQIPGFLDSSFSSPPTCSCSRHFSRCPLSLFLLPCGLLPPHPHSELSQLHLCPSAPALAEVAQTGMKCIEWNGKQGLSDSGVPQSHHSLDFPGS